MVRTLSTFSHRLGGSCKCSGRRWRRRSCSDITLLSAVFLGRPNTYLINIMMGTHAVNAVASCVRYTPVARGGQR